MQSRGRMITFEGMDGCGKSTQIRLLVEKLRSREIPVEIREPKERKIGKKIWQLVLYHSYGEINPVTELLLFFAIRAQHYAKVLKPALLEGKLIICDRFIDSSIAYQGYGLGIERSVIEYLHTITTDNLIPDLTFFLDLSPHKCLSRCRNLDRIEKRGIEFLNRVYRGFLIEAKRQRNRIKQINADRDIEEIEQEIWDVTQKYLQYWRIMKRGKENELRTRN